MTTYGEWTQFMPEECPWCGSKDRPGRFCAGSCNNSWHVDHPEHDLMWPTWVRV